MYKALTFCQFFLSNDTRRLTAKWMLYTSSSSVIFMWPTATARHSTFFIWNLIVDFTSSALGTTFSLWVSKEENLPALFRPGPRNQGICLIRDSEAKKAPYFLASFLTSVLYLLSFFQCLDVHVGEIHSLGLITMLPVPQDTYRELGVGSGLKPDGA